MKTTVVDVDALPHTVRKHVLAHAEHDRAVRHLIRNPLALVGPGQVHSLDPISRLATIKRLRLAAKDALTTLGYNTDGSMISE